MKQFQKQTLIRFALAAVFLPAVALPVCAQQMVHAVSGTIVSVIPNFKMIEVSTSDGADSHFQWIRSDKDKIEFDKNVSADSTAVNASAVKGTHIIVYYIGDGDPRVAVALRDLGASEVQDVTGTIVKLDRKEHVLVVKNIDGAELTFHLDAKTVGDTPNGVLENFKFDFNKGTYIRVTYTQVDGVSTAWLIASGL
ncbi:MAG TPA: hypothetical protein VII58_10020 [Acidobacteriaceae bacterium]